MKLVEMLGSTKILSANVSLDIDFRDIKYNSKNVEKGDVFVVIKGSSADGSLYIEEALAKGAVCIITETIPYNAYVPYVLVESTRKALANMSKLFFAGPDEKLRIIGITGTNGKTSTSYFLRHILTEKFGQRVGLIGTNQNMIGPLSRRTKNTTPQSYEIYKLMREMVDNGCNFCIMEVSSHGLVQHRTYGIEFELGIFTNLTGDHLDYHGTFENYKNAKRRLFDASKTCIINVDDGSFNDVAENTSYHTITYSARQKNADICACNIVHKGGNTEYDVIYKGKTHHISVPVPGMFTVYNTMAAISAALQLGIDMDEIAGALTTAQAASGRCEYVECNQPFDVMIDFAHTPDGMESVLSMARQLTSGRIITVFGCGGDRDKTKRPIMGNIAAKYSDKVVVTSDNVRTEKPLNIARDILVGIENASADVDMVLDRAKAIHYAMSCANAGDMVLLLGKGHEKYIEKNGIKTHFDEREIVRNYRNC